MRIEYRDIVLRDCEQGDIEDELRWMNVQTQWMDEDTPWERAEPVDPAFLREEMLDMIRDAAANDRRSRLEILAGDRHIGFVCAYPFATADLAARTGAAVTGLALGIELCEPEYWGRGYGSQALAAWTRYCLDQGATHLFLETWSGNRRMMRCAEKLGYSLCLREIGARTVNGRSWDALTYALDIGGFNAVY